MEHGLESQPKSSNFENILLFAALVNLAERCPVVVPEHGTVPCIEGGSLVCFEFIIHYTIDRVPSPID